MPEILSLPPLPDDDVAAIDQLRSSYERLTKDLSKVIVRARAVLNETTFESKKFYTLCAQLKRKNLKDLYFAYFRSQSWISSLSVNINSMMELNETLELFQTPRLDENECNRFDEAIQQQSEEKL